MDDDLLLRGIVAKFSARLVPLELKPRRLAQDLDPAERVQLIAWLDLMTEWLGRPPGVRGSQPVG
jgi:hypothetical protein